MGGLWSSFVERTVWEVESVDGIYNKVLPLFSVNAEILFVYPLRFVSKSFPLVLDVDLQYTFSVF